jgi:hypothetical protein
LAQSAPAAAAPVTAKPPTAAATTNQPDYSQGFRTFIRMGLPDTSKAKYVKLDYYGGGQPDMMMYRMQEIQMAGNAWLISENKDDKSVLVSASGRTLELADQKTAMKKQMDEARSNAVAQAKSPKKGTGPRPSSIATRRFAEGLGSGTWTSVDLSRDLVKATAFLDKKIKAKAAGGREMRYDDFMRSDEPAGVLFLFAAFAWQNGKVQEANALVGRLFTLVGDSRKVIVGALNVLADGQLAAAADDFRKTGDWTAYHTAVAGLLKKYPAGWRKAGAVKLLAARLQARSAMPEAPAVTGEGLGEEDLKLAAALASATNQAGMQMWNGQLWILPQPKAMRFMKDDSVIGRIKARGVKSIPLLIALVPDETLCQLRRNDSGMSSYMSFSGDDASVSEEDRARLVYNQMDRPMTRGEIARTLLAPLSPRDENARQLEGDADPEEVIEGARKVYEAVKNLPPASLAQYYLKNGDQSQKQAAISAMVASDVESNAPVIEAFLLTPPTEDASEHMMGNGFVQQYVQKRGEQAAEFVEKYAAMRKKIEMPSHIADNPEYVKMMEKQAENEIKTLRALVKKQDLAALIATLANSSDEDGGSMAAYAALEHQPPAKSLPLLLAAAVKATNVASRARILQMMPMLRYSGMQESMQEDEEDGEVDSDGMPLAMKQVAEKNKLNIGTNAADWKLLLADTRAMPGGRMYSGGTYEMTVADMAASSIESLYGDVSAMGPYGHRGGAGTLKPEVAMKITRERAAARLAGTPEDQLPKMPSADDVSAERRKAIEADILKATPAKLGSLLDKLTDAEGLYLAELANEKEEVMKALSSLSRIIASVATPPSLPEAEAARLKKLAGSSVTTNAIAEIRDICKRQLAAGTAFMATLSSAGLGRGLRLDVIAVDEATQAMYGSGYSSMLSNTAGGRKGIVQGSLRNGRNYGHGMWLVDLPAQAAPTGTVAAAQADSDDNSEDRLVPFESTLESQNEQFETAADTFCKPDESLEPGAMVSFTAILPAKESDKKKSASGEDVRVIMD